MHMLHAHVMHMHMCMHNDMCMCVTCVSVSTNYLSLSLSLSLSICTMIKHCVAHLPAGEDASPDAGWAHDLTRGAVTAALHEVRRKAEP
jgi:hypothetical protein